MLPKIADNVGMAEYLDKLVYARIGDYVLVRLIGRATHYTLYQAADPQVGRMVLIKILHVLAAPTSSTPSTEPAVAESAQEAALEQAHAIETRLQREAQALGSLSHPNVPAIYGTGEHDGYSFLVMEYVYGHPLRQHLDQKALPLEEAGRILEQLADAVDAVHAKEILHRDIRPSNVMISRNGNVKLVDFGLARQPGDTTVTLMGALVGEPSYMAPEQLRNKPASRESDLWAMGVLLYEMLAGQPPFQGSSFPLVAHQVIMGTPAPIPGVSAAVQAVVNKALEKDPDKRYQSAHEMVKALRKAAGGFSSPILRFEEPRDIFVTQKTAVAIGAGAALLAALVTMGIYLTHAVLGAPPPVPTAAAATLPTSAPPSTTSPR